MRKNGGTEHEVIYTHRREEKGKSDDANEERETGVEGEEETLKGTFFSTA